jgi:3-dehydroquinate synthase
MNIAQHYFSLFKTDLTIEIIEFDSGENKNIETCVQIWNVLTELGADRRV